MTPSIQVSEIAAHLRNHYGDSNDMPWDEVVERVRAALVGIPVDRERVRQEIFLILGHRSRDGTLLDYISETADELADAISAIEGLGDEIHG